MRRSWEADLGGMAGKFGGGERSSLLFCKLEKKKRGMRLDAVLV